MLLVNGAAKYVDEVGSLSAGFEPTMREYTLKLRF